MAASLASCYFCTLPGETFSPGGTNGPHCILMSALARRKRVLSEGSGRKFLDAT